MRAVIKLDEALAQAAATRERTWPVQMPARNFDKPVGSIEIKMGRFGSRIERTVIEALAEAGIPVLTHHAVRVPNLLEQSGKTWLCTPDALVYERWCIEVDSPGWEHRPTGHNLGFPASDLYRDDCLRAAGMNVIRLRLGGLEAVPDSLNYVTDSASATKAVVSEFTQMVAQAIAREP